MSTGWSIYIVVIVLINVTGALWLLWWTARRRDGEKAGQTTHVWDDDLTELNNPLPRWWLWLFYLTVVFAAGYLILYPGMGSFKGVLCWTQEKQHDEQVAQAESRYAERFARYDSMDLKTLSHTPDAMAMARNLFAANCTTCHGSDARGANGFPNLTDKDWLHGGDPDTIYKTIAEGRHGVMPAFGEVLGAQGTEEVVAYVLKISGHDVPREWIAAGETKFQQICSACHGMDGRGNQQLGAPNLTDRTWLYSDSPEAIRSAIQHGHDNRMPAHLELLGPQKVRLLAAYVLNVSSSPADGIAQR